MKHSLRQKNPDTVDRKQDRRGLLKKLIGLFAGGVAVSSVPQVFAGPRTSAPPSMLMSAEPILGSIGIFAGNFAPRGWAFCNGQLLSIAQNTALFSLLGTTYGGNGQTTFALPNLQGRTPIHAGQGSGLSNRNLGEQGGTESHTLMVGEIPAHAHALNANSAVGTTDTAAGNVIAKNAAGVPQFSAAPDSPMAASSIGATGGSQPHNNMPPFLALNYCIALEGIFPSRN